MRAMSQNISEKFWEDWLKADDVERHVMLKPIAKIIMDAAKSGISIEGFTTLLKSYFDDLAEACGKTMLVKLGVRGVE